MYRYFSGLEATDTFDFARIPLLFSRRSNEIGTFVQPTVAFSLSWQRKPFIQPNCRCFFPVRAAKSVSSISVSLLFPGQGSEILFLTLFTVAFFPPKQRKPFIQPNCRCFFPVRAAKSVSSISVSLLFPGQGSEMQVSITLYRCF
jgi:hypothetical protein